MKRLFLFAGVLMVGATIYGFVDYNKAKHNKRLNSLYHEYAKREPAVKPASKEENKVVEADNSSNSNKIDVISEDAKPSLKTEGKVRDKKFREKRKVSYESFSRAPLKEGDEVIKIDSTIKPIKTKDQ